MRSFLSLLSLDLRNVWLTFVPLMMLGSVVLQGALLRWVVPDQLEQAPSVRIVDNTEGRLFARMLSKEPDLALPFAKELSEWVAKDRGRVGLIFSGNNSDPGVEIVHAGDADSGAVAKARTTATIFWNRFAGLNWAEGHKHSHLGLDRQATPFNGVLLGLLLALDLALGAVLFLAMMIFEEKATGAIEAIKLSPVGSLQYLAAKICATLIHSLPPMLVLLLMVKQEALASIDLWMVMVATLVGFSFFGVILGVLLKSLFESAYAVVFSLYALLLPVFAYFLPVLDQFWLHLIPTWGTLYGVRAALFPTGRPDDVLLAIQSMLPAFAVFVLVALALVQRRLLRRDR
jgi:hypothetical protein